MIISSICSRLSGIHLWLTLPGAIEHIPQVRWCPVWGREAEDVPKLYGYLCGSRGMLWPCVQKGRKSGKTGDCPLPTFAPLAMCVAQSQYTVIEGLLGTWACGYVAWNLVRAAYWSEWLPLHCCNDIQRGTLSTVGPKLPRWWQWGVIACGLLWTGSAKGSIWFGTTVHQGLALTRIHVSASWLYKHFQFRH